MKKHSIPIAAQIAIFVVTLVLAIWLISLDPKIGVAGFFAVFIFTLLLFGMASDLATPNYIPETVPAPIPQPPPPQKPSPIEDVGLIAYWGEQSAYLYRTQAIPNTAHAIQPYVQLHISQAATYHLRFDILDAQDTLIFTHTVEPLLVQATNLILPPARLPLADLPHDAGAWTLRVDVDGALATTHRFMWRSDNIDQLAGNIDSDGEIDESILPLLADNYAQPMSLDALLAGKNDSPITSKARDVQ